MRWTKVDRMVALMGTYDTIEREMRGAGILAEAHRR